jgi:hypothetical protein
LFGVEVLLALLELLDEAGELCVCFLEEFAVVLVGLEEEGDDPEEGDFYESSCEVCLVGVGWWW